MVRLLKHSDETKSFMSLVLKERKKAAMVNFWNKNNLLLSVKMPRPIPPNYLYVNINPIFIGKRVDYTSMHGQTTLNRIPK